MTHLFKTGFTFALLMGLFLPATAQAQITEVKQTVFGMDCAPCAYALQKKLERIGGVEDVKVSLDNGLATIRLQEDNRATLGSIREAVEESGFSPEDAVLSVTGTLHQQGGKLLLRTEGGERFVLQKDGTQAAAFDRLSSTKAGQRVTATGRVGTSDEGKENRWTLAVLSTGERE